MKQIIRFSVHVSAKVSFILDIPLKQLGQTTVTELAVEKALYMQTTHGWFTGMEINEETIHDIKFLWQGWID